MSSIDNESELIKQEIKTLEEINNKLNIHPLNTTNTVSLDPTVIENIINSIISGLTNVSPTDINNIESVITNSQYWTYFGGSYILLGIATIIYIYGSYYFYGSLVINNNYIYGLIACLYLLFTVIGNIVNIAKTQNSIVPTSTTTQLGISQITYKVNNSYVSKTVKFNSLLILLILPIILFGVFLYIEYTFTALCIYVTLIIVGNCLYIYYLQSQMQNTSLLQRIQVQ